MRALLDTHSFLWFIGGSERLVAHLTELVRLPHHHRDPFDRLLVAQARAENLPIVSVDEALDRYEIERLW
jgi:PIN domain nuclease of toxin-antitoxin system